MNREKKKKRETKREREIYEDKEGEGERRRNAKKCARIDIKDVRCQFYNTCLTNLILVQAYTLPPPPPVSMTRKRVHWGHTQFRVRGDPEFGQLSVDLTNNGVRLTQLLGSIPRQVD